MTRLELEPPACYLLMLSFTAGVCRGRSPACHAPAETIPPARPARLLEGFGKVRTPGHTCVHVNRWNGTARAFEASAQLDREYLVGEGELSDHTAGPYSHNLHFLATV